MTSNNTLSFQRLTLLLRQNFLHHYKLFGIYVAAFAGGVFMLLLAIQMADEFREQPIGKFFGIFLTLFIITSVLATGTAFPNLRTKEKALTYLLLPASALEKLIVELLMRVLFFIILVPALYWAVFGIENFMISAINPDYHLTGNIKLDLPDPPRESDLRGLWYMLFISLTLSMFLLPFAGSTIFVKNPLIKTLFALALIVVFNVFVIYFFVEVLHFKDYNPPTKHVLFISSAKGALTAGTIASVMFNIGLLAASYFKLKEREV